MNEKNLDLLGLKQGAAKEEITAAYNELRAKYLEERFLDGEAGNNAAKMLTKIETAYSELMREFEETAADFGEGGFTRVEELIRANDLTEAQRVLDSFNERGAQWHYLQSVVFYKKNWINESKKQLEIAIQLEPNNDKYKETYKKLNDKINSDTKASGGPQGVYEGQTMNSAPQDEQMGGSCCASCIECYLINLCVNCLCNGCCR